MLKLRQRRMLYVAPDMPGWTEDRRRGVCFEHLYAALYGYSLCFDPYILAETQSVPVLCEAAKAGEVLHAFDVLVCSDARLSDGLQGAWDPARAAVWMGASPQTAAPFSAKDTPYLQALRDPLEFDSPHDIPAFLPERDRYAQTPNAYLALEPAAGDRTFGSVAGRPMWLVRGTVAVCALPLFPRFLWEGFSPALSAGAATVFARATLAAMGSRRSSVPAVDPSARSLRRDFHAFGIAYVLVDSAFRTADVPLPALDSAFRSLLQAARHAAAGAAHRARADLALAFRALAAVRSRAFPLDLQYIDMPHNGILSAWSGLAEGEWPEYTRRYLEYMADLAERLGYRFTLEYNVGSWVRLGERYPKLIRRIARLWAQGRIELVHGSWSGPMLQYADVELAAREFELGQQGLHRCFGRRCESYACQEFSFTPALPGLLRQYGFRRAVHLTQNRGQVPLSKHLFLDWQGKDGTRIPALGHDPLSLVKRGVNFYLERFRTFTEARRRGVRSFVDVCMQDQSRLVFREELVRAEQYAPVLGRHRTLADALPADGTRLPAEPFRFDRYQWEQPVNGPISWDWISMFQRIFAWRHRAARAEMLAATTGTAKDAGTWDTVWDWILYCQSHDNTLVPGGIPGDFYSGSAPDYVGVRLMPPDSYGAILAAQAPDVDRLLGTVERQALLKLGLEWPHENTMPSKGFLFNPYPTTRIGGGWFPCRLPDGSFRAEGLRVCIWKGRCYWSGTVAVQQALSLGTHTPLRMAFGGRAARGTNPRVRIARGGRICIVQTGKPALWLRPVAAGYPPFRRIALDHAAHGDFQVSRAVWETRNVQKAACRVKLLLVRFNTDDSLHLHAEITGWTAPGERKYEDLLALEVAAASGWRRFSCFAGHFTETSRKRNVTSSPYLAHAQTEGCTLAVLNYGNIWLRNTRRNLQLCLMVPHETERRRDFTLGWDLADPVLRAVQALEQPLLLTGRPIAAALRLAMHAPGVWLSSWRPDGRMRLSETRGKAAEAALSITPAPAGAVLETFCGEDRRSFPCRDGIVRVPLRPWESLQVRLNFARGPGARHNAQGDSSPK